ncbi:helix-turn-helix domain-containing protein [Pelosinus fermentans]|uniref:Helix-turn-helix domain protein n=1 Tax=Pelosinus fermentans JBW45 TaxID=1192197 RepID=I9NML7_9FIRM|nr:helix-turn-helix transcriptional regulator [Pelosinus fermentans]AJQ26880.1 helix-turn-helix domain protein [Pelosinus fermentans JBW45]
MSLIDTIQKLCSRENTTLIGLEREIGLGRGTIRNWDKSSPSIDKLQKVADYFDVSIDYLIGTNQNDFFRKILNEFKCMVNEKLQKEKLSIDELSLKLSIDPILLAEALDDNTLLTYKDFAMMLETMLNNIRRENIKENIINYFFDFLDLHSKIFKYEYNRPYDEPFKSFHKNDLNLENKELSTKYKNSSSLSPKEERDIARDLEKMLSNLESREAMSFYDGEPLDEESKELLRISLENSMRLAKQMAKKKFTPKKYRKEE